MIQPLGLYIHVPFCVSKCPYCDFYSLPRQTLPADIADAYTEAVVRSLEQWHHSLANPAADTLYFGGGTPSLLGATHISRIIDTAARLFGLPHAEITMEANPADTLRDIFRAFVAAGGNRVSLGMQSSNEAELAKLGRRHHPWEVEAAVEAAHAAGIGNLSLDIMLGLEDQAAESVTASVQTAGRLGAKHVSAYLLKIEEGTPFFSQKSTLRLPDEDTAAALYLSACRQLDTQGYAQYEISNFSIPGYESRHNLKYWNADPYLGIGPSAHSFVNGRRFYYPRDLAGFLNGNEPVSECGENESRAIAEASEEEYLMLRLRLAQGISGAEFSARFGHALPEIYYERASRLPSSLISADTEGIRLTREGFLLSNAVIAHILG